LTYWVDFSELSQSMASGDVWVAANVWADTYRSLLDQGVPVQYREFFHAGESGGCAWMC
jgi:spermidine/putrescine-binding protein